jgi:hypothetical protein
MNNMSHCTKKSGGWTGRLTLLAGLLLLAGVLVSLGGLPDSASLAAREPAMTSAPDSLSQTGSSPPQARGAVATALFAAG